MINGWRSDRRIGPPRFSERLRENTLWPLITVSAGAAMATLSVWVKFDHLWIQITSWPITFTIYSVFFIFLSLTLSRWNWIEASISTSIVALVFLIASKMKLAIYSAILGYEPAIIIPVTP